MSNTPEQIDPFADFLVAYDLLHTLGVAREPAVRSGGEEPLDADLAMRLKESQACIDLLNRRWATTDAKVDGQATVAKFLDYEIRSLIGAGGHGLVFLANDTRLKRNFALKVPRPEWLQSESLRARFLREAQAVARLRHPGIVPIYYFGESDSVCYIAAQYIDGPNLDQWLRSRKTPCEPEVAARLIRKLCDAVGHAHERGVLHRDLKPSNILLELSEDPELPVTPLITDFGLAKLLGEGGDQTRTGAYCLGTPGYMAPEQLNGGKIGAAADVYALGAILHTMLIGRPPKLEKRSQKPAVLPEGLRRIVTHCLENEPGDRYLSVAALDADLERFLSGRRIRHGRLAMISRRTRRFRRHPAIVWVLGAPLLTALALAAREFRTEEPATIRKEVESPIARSNTTPRRSRFIAAVRQTNDLHQGHHFKQAIKQLEIARADADPEDLKGFAWRYLENYGDREVLSFQGHTEDAYCSRFSPDGTLLATGGKDGKIRLWEMPTGRLASEMTVIGSDVKAISFSPDGATILSAGTDSIVRFWDVKKRALVRSFDTKLSEIVVAAFHPSGKWIYCACRSGDIYEFDTHTLVRSFWNLTSKPGVESIAISPIDGSFVVPGVTPSLVQYRLESDSAGVRREVLGIGFFDDSRQWRTAQLYAIAMSSDGKLLAAARVNEFDHPISVWDTLTQKVVYTLKGHFDDPCALAFSPDSRVLASAAKDETVRLWDLTSGKLIHTFTGHHTRIWSIAFSPLGRFVASTAADGTVKLWDTHSIPRRLAL